MKSNVLNSLSVLVAYIYVTALLFVMLFKGYQLDNNNLFLTMISVGHVIVDRIKEEKSRIFSLGNLECSLLECTFTI